MGEPRRRQRRRKPGVVGKRGAPAAPDAGGQGKRHKDRRVDRHVQIVAVSCAQEGRRQRVNGGEKERQGPRALGGPAESPVAGGQGAKETQDQGDILELPERELVERHQVDRAAKIMEIGGVSKRVHPPVERILGLARQGGQDPVTHLGDRIGNGQAVVKGLAGPHEPPVEKGRGREKADGNERGQGG